MAALPSPLQSELEQFEARRKEWVREHAGEFVVIHDAFVDGFFPDYESALKHALRSIGFDQLFLIKQVCSQDPVFYIY